MSFAVKRFYNVDHLTRPSENVFDGQEEAYKAMFFWTIIKYLIVYAVYKYM